MSRFQRAILMDTKSNEIVATDEELVTGGAYFIAFLRQGVGQRWELEQAI